MEEKEEVSRELEPTRERRRFIRLSNRPVGTVLLPVAPETLGSSARELPVPHGSCSAGFVFALSLCNSGPCEGEHSLVNE